MKLNLSKLLKASFSIAAIFLLAASSAALILPVIRSEETVSVFSSTESTTGFIPKVIDGRTGLPIEGAVVIIPETGKSYQTDHKGEIEAIRIPYSAKSDYDSILPKNWCEVTLLAYAEGYAPYALFYLQLQEGSLREGPVVMLFPGEQDPFSIIEGPPDWWVSELLKKFSPRSFP